MSSQIAKIALFTAAIAGTCLFAKASGAVDCPPGAKSCKVLILSPEEEAILTNQNGILDTAARARSLDLSGPVQYFLQKIQSAAAGTVPEPAKPEQK